MNYNNRFNRIKRTFFDVCEGFSVGFKKITNSISNLIDKCNCCSEDYKEEGNFEINNDNTNYYGIDNDNISVNLNDIMNINVNKNFNNNRDYF